MEQVELKDNVLVEDISVSLTEIDNTESSRMDTGTILGLLPILILLLIMFVRLIFVIYKSNGQKTRTSQQRRTYMGSRQRPSDSQSEPTVFVSPANLPPPPKYEAMAPPSYEEVVGVHYPSFQAPVQPLNQPITQPITLALAQSSNSTNESNNSPSSNATAPRNDDVTTSTVVTVTNERTQVTVTAS